MKRILAVIILMCLVASMCMAADVSLAWDPSATTSITGYKVYFGNAARTYRTPITIGKQTAYTVTGLSDGIYFFAVTAFDSSGNESDFSNEISTTITTISPPGGLKRTPIQRVTMNIDVPDDKQMALRVEFNDK
jgi:hypothetical protein